MAKPPTTSATTPLKPSSSHLTLPLMCSRRFIFQHGLLRLKFSSKISLISLLHFTLTASSTNSSPLFPTWPPLRVLLSSFPELFLQCLAKFKTAIPPINTQISSLLQNVATSTENAFHLSSTGPSEQLVMYLLIICTFKRDIKQIFPACGNDPAQLILFFPISTIYISE